MIIHFLGDSSFLVKTKLAEITVGKETRIGELTLSGPGEYEVLDVQVVGYPGAYLFSAEDLNLLYVENPSINDEVLKNIEEDIDVLLLSVNHDQEQLKAAVKVMNDIDPKVAIPTVDSADHPFCKEVGGCPEKVNELKVSAKDLAEGERKVVILHARSRSRQ